MMILFAHLRMRRELGGTTFVADFAALDDVDAIGEFGGKAHILLGQKHGSPGFLQASQPIEQRPHDNGASPSDGSSSSKSVGLPSNVRAMATMRCWPPDSDEACR